MADNAGCVRPDFVSQSAFTNARGHPHVPLHPLNQMLDEERPWLSESLAQHDRILWVAARPGVDATRADCLHLHVEDTTLLGGAIRAPIDAWPFRDRCFDHVLLHHTLDFSRLAAVVVSEALRVLKPERELWIAGIGPASWQRWRLAWTLPGADRPRPPRLGQLKTLLASHGCVDVAAEVLGPSATPRRAHETTGRYLLCARKREIRPIESGKRVRKLVPKPGAWSPTTRDVA